MKLVDRLAMTERQLDEAAKAFMALSSVHKQVCAEYVRAMEVAASLVYMLNVEQGWGTTEPVTILDDDRKRAWEGTRLRLKFEVVEHDEAPNELVVSPIEWTEEDAEKAKAEKPAIEAKGRRSNLSLLGPDGTPIQ